MKAINWRPSLRRGLPIALALIAATPAWSQSGCPSDCSGDRSVSINELIRCVGVVLGSVVLAECPSCDADGSGTVGVNDLIRGVNASLGRGDERLVPTQGSRRSVIASCSPCARARCQ